MLKPAALRAEIVSFLPELERDPHRLTMWSERGNMRATQTRERGFAWEYDLEIMISDFTGEPALLFFVVQNWCRTQQPELLAPGAAAIPFEVEFIDSKTVDVKLTLALSEVVKASAVPGSAGAAWQLETLAEAVPLFPDAEPIRALEAPIAEIWIRQGEIVRKVAPAEAVAA